MKSRRSVSTLWLHMLFLCFLASCQSYPADPSGAPWIGRRLWTATNLRLFGKKDIHWQNYLQAEILRAGTAVRLTDVNAEQATFIDTEDSEYRLHWRGQGAAHGASFAEEMHRYFQEEDPNAELEKLSPQDLQNIDIGALKRGMSKRHVLLSCGHPCDAKNPMDLDMWIYFLNPQSRCVVYFERGEVAQIVK